MTFDELKATAADVARALEGAGTPLDNDLRKRFIAVRTELFRRGIFDPVLSRFDSATVPPPPPQQLAEHLRALAEQIHA